MSTLDSLNEKLRKVVAHPLVAGRLEGPCHQHSNLSALQPQTFSTGANGPMSDPEYQQFLWWQATHQQQQGHQAGSVIKPNAQPLSTHHEANPLQASHICCLPHQPAGHAAFPVEPMIITKKSINGAHNGQMLYIISTGPAPSSLSSRSLITITRPLGEPEVGTVHFHSFSSSNIDITVSGESTTLRYDGSMTGRRSYRSCSSQPTASRGQTWWWQRGEDKQTLVLTTEKKNGQILATLRGYVLVFERASPWTVEEIVVTAVAMMRAAKRSEEASTWVESIGEIVGAAGGGGGA